MQEPYDSAVQNVNKDEEYLPDNHPRLQIASAGRMGCPNLGLYSINLSIAELNSVALAYWKSQ